MGRLLVGLAGSFLVVRCKRLAILIIILAPFKPGGLYQSTRPMSLSRTIRNDKPFPARIEAGAVERRWTEEGPSSKRVLSSVSTGPQETACTGPCTTRRPGPQSWQSGSLRYQDHVSRSSLCHAERWTASLGNKCDRSTLLTGVGFN